MQYEIINFCLYLIQNLDIFTYLKKFFKKLNWMSFMVCGISEIMGCLAVYFIFLNRFIMLNCSERIFFISYKDQITFFLMQLLNWEADLREC